MLGCLKKILVDHGIYEMGRLGRGGELDEVFGEPLYFGGRAGQGAVSWGAGFYGYFRLLNANRIACETSILGTSF